MVLGKKAVVAFVLAMMLLPVLPAALADQTISVETDAKYYRPGETVKIEGEAAAGAKVHVTINMTSTQLFSVDVNASSVGEFNATYNLAADAELGVYTVKASTATGTAQTSFYVVKADLKEMAEDIIQLAENAEKEANETLKELKEEDVDILPSATENYDHGVEALEKARSFLAEGKYVAAVEMAHSALVHFGNSLRSAATSVKKDAADEAHEVMELRHEIDRAYKLVAKLNATATRLKEEGKDVSAIEAKLKDAKSHLDEASALFDEGKLSEAESAYESAEEAIEEAMGLLKGMVAETKLEYMERFRERLRERLNATEEALERLREYIAGAKENATMARLRGIYKQLEQIREKILEKSSDEALKGLKDASKGLDDSLDELDGESYGQALRQMNRLRATIQALEGSSDKWDKWGFNSTQLDEKIGRNRERLEEILSDLGKNKPKDAEGIAEQGLEDLKNPQKWGHGPRDEGDDEEKSPDFPWSHWSGQGGPQSHGKGGK